MKRAAASAAKVKRGGTAQVDAYLASLPANVRSGLEKLREAILAAAPGAEQGISYGMPAFWLDGRPLVSFAAFTRHSSLFPGAVAVRAHAAALQDYVTSKGTIQFPPDRPPPAGLVAKLVKTRIAALQEDRQ